LIVYSVGYALPLFVFFPLSENDHCHILLGHSKIYTATWEETGKKYAEKRLWVWIIQKKVLSLHKQFHFR